MIQPIQIFGWIILVILPVIFFVAVKPEKTAQFKDIKRIICFVFMGIFALGIIANLLSLFQLGGRIPPSVWQFLSLWGFRPSITPILIPLFSGNPGFWDFWMAAGRFIFPLLNLLFSAGMIFFYFTKANQKEGLGSFTTGESQFLPKGGSGDGLGKSNQAESKFSGGVLPVFLFWIWAPILLTITLFLALPFIYCTVIRWVCSNSTIGGKRYKFKGTAGGLFARYIVWYLLTIITFGIYGFWSMRNQIRWIIESIEMVD